MIAVYPGSFDPVTFGHADIIRRVSAVSDVLIIGVTDNVNKKLFFNLDQRINFLLEMVTGLTNVTVKPFSGMLVDFAAQNGADVIVRGLRQASVGEYEYQMVQANMKYSAKNGSFLDTFFVLSRPEFAHVSSSLAKEIVMSGGDAGDMIPKSIIEAIKRDT